MSSTFDYCILGAGIAGLSLADALQERGQSVCVVEKHQIGAGASGTPGGLVNPATGRRATKTWKAEECYKAISDNLEKVKPYSKEPFFTRNGVLRPAITEKMAAKMWERFQETTWPEGWCQWLTDKEIKDRHPGISCIKGGLWLPVGITVDVAKYLSGLTAFLKEEGIEVYTGNEPVLGQINTHWEIKLPECTFQSQQLIYATGYATLSTEFWRDLPLNPIKGQVARFKVEDTNLSFKHSVSSLGYIANLKSNGTFIQGSTYEHDFENVEPSKFGEDYLRKRLRRTLPELESHSKIIGQWAGVRVSTPNRKPVLGRHKEIDNLYLFTGLGSKGLMYGKFLADHLTEHLVSGADLFEEVDIQRLYG